jgi:prepilin-type N-terminal cleavage/methylation domain-containing protein
MTPSTSLQKDMTMPRTQPSRSSQQGFSLIELMLAMGVTVIITGSMYGLIASSSGAFNREPSLTDRQQQIRIAMTRIQDDVLKAGIGLGNTFQSFGQLKNGFGPLGVRVLGDAALGGGNSDYIEIRMKTDDCPSVRVDPSNPRNGSNYNSIDAWPSCYPEPGWVLAFFPDGNAKWGWGHNQHGSSNSKFNFPPGQQPPDSQMEGVNNLSCGLDLAVIGGTCPAANQGEAIYFMQMDRIFYLIANDTDGTPGLFRSQNGGYDVTTEAYSAPPSASWQLVARGIEDMQIRYRIQSGWVNDAPVIVPTDASPFDNVVREVEITLWARTVGQIDPTTGLAKAPAATTGQTTAAGNGVTAVRGSLTTSVAPRAAQMALQFETAVAKRWQ